MNEYTVINELYPIVSLALLKLSIIVWFLFYWLPQRVFPQTGIADLPDKIMFNSLYMLVFIELFVPLLLIIKIYSIVIFFLSIFLFKLFILHFYEKRNLRVLFKEKKQQYYAKLLDTFEDRELIIDDLRASGTKLISTLFDSLSFAVVAKYFIFFFIFFYTAYLFITRGFLTLSYALPDTPQFVEWVASMSQNVFYDDQKTAGADFYGTSILAFILYSLSNINSLILFNIFPYFVVLFLLFTIFYILYKSTYSIYAALFAVFMFGVVIMGPNIDLFTGIISWTTNPESLSIFGMNFYHVTELEGTLTSTPVAVSIGPYWRYAGGLPYELASMFFLPNVYFLTKTLETKQNVHLMLYAITLCLVFTFHGGTAMFLLPTSILIALNAVLFRKLSFDILIRGVATVIVATLLGNLWLLATLKYGAIDHAGAALPILDTLFGDLQEDELKSEAGILRVVILTPVQYFLIAATLVFFVISFFFRNRFLLNSVGFAVITAGVIYFAANLGLPEMVYYERAADFLLISWAVISGFVFFVISDGLCKYILRRRFDAFMRILFLSIVFLTIFALPKWHEKEIFWKKLSGMENSEFSYVIYKIEREFQAFSWTIVAHSQAFAKIKGKGYHINMQDFLFGYNSLEEHLQIPTNTVFVIEDITTSSYGGTGEWWNRWNDNIRDNAKKWIVSYSLNHTNIETWFHGNNLKVYKIDNTGYVKMLNKEKKRARKIETRKQQTKEVSSETKN